MMQNPRIFLWIALALVLWLNYEAWLRDYTPKPGAVITNTRGAGNSVSAATKPRDLSTAVPQASSSRVEASSTPAQTNPTEVIAPPASAGLVHVRTDVFDLDISEEGGTLQRVDLPGYPKVKGGNVPVRLMNKDSAETLYLLQMGLTGPANTARPTHLAALSSDRHEYELGNAAELRVPLKWSDGHGVEVTKTYIFRHGQYRIDVRYDVENHSGAAWQAAPYAQILRNDPPTKRSMFNVETYAFHGPALYDGAKYRKLNVKNEEDRHLALEINNGWVAALQHHFVSAIIPAKDTPYRYTLNAEGGDYLASTAGPMATVADGATGKFNQTLYVGPKLQGQLELTGPRLELVADYGKLTILAKPLFWLLQKIHNLFGNWGLAIVIVTFLLKLAFYPLSETSGRSMAKMKLLAPRIKNLQETYKDDREKLGRAMMELYQREKVNPVAGCLPIIIQIPVFLAFYWVLLESVEMRQAPFMGWINDLSSRDPWFILPIIMAAAMFVQYKLNPQVGDPVQQKVMMIMPLGMSVMFAFFPAGLVLYWVTNTLLSIAQQWNINRRIEAGRKS